MEKKLKQLFDYQRFEGEPHLEKLIRAAEKRRAISDDEAEAVSAAGIIRKRENDLDNAP